MKQSISRRLVVSLLFLLAGSLISTVAQPASYTKANLKSKSAPWATLAASPIVIYSSNAGVRIQVNNHSLTDVLFEISHQTGIRFKVDHSLEHHTLTASFQAPDWKTAVETLLEEISTVTLWSKKSRMSEVILLGNHDGSEVLFSVPNGSNKSSKNSQNAPLTKKQLKKLAKGPYQSPLSPEFLEDPKYRAFLHKQGVKTKEDLKQIKKAMQVRQAAKLQLRSLQKKARAKILSSPK